MEETTDPTTTAPTSESQSSDTATSPGVPAESGSSESEASDSSETQNTTIFVGSIPFESTEAEITRFFSHCGAIENCKLLLDPQTRRFKGSCFIRFDTVEAAQNACALNGNAFMGRKLYISMSTSKPAPQTTPHVFIGNLDASSDIDTLYQFFSSCGSVVNIKLITDKLTMRNKGFGFVEFADEQSAKNSLALNGTMLGSRPIRVDFQRPKTTRTNRTRGSSGRGGRNNAHHSFASHVPSHVPPPHAPSQLGWNGASAPFPGHYPPNYPHLHSHHPHHAQGPQGIIPHPHSHGHPYYPPSRTVHYGFQGYPMQFPVGTPPAGGYPPFPPYHMPADAPPADAEHAARAGAVQPNSMPALPASMMKQQSVGPSSTLPQTAPGQITSPLSSPQSRHPKIPGQPPYPSYVLPESPSAAFTYPHDYHLHSAGYPPTTSPASHQMGHHDQFE